MKTWAASSRMNSDKPDSAHSATTRLVIVTRHRLDGAALAALFHACPHFRVLCATTSPRVAAVEGRHRRPDVIVLDGGMIGCDADQSIASMLHQLREIPILVLDDDVHYGRLAIVLDSPKMGYFTRSAPFPELSEGIRRLATGEQVFDLTVKSRIHHTPQGWEFRRDQPISHLARLTSREIEVLRLIAQGNSVKCCAKILELAPSTVDNHKSRLMKKLGVHKSLDLTRLALREGLIHSVGLIFPMLIVMLE